jgi:hypothetical protein
LHHQHRLLHHGLTRFRQGHLNRGPFAHAATPGMIYQNLPHHPGGQPQKVLAILKVQLALAPQPQVGFVNQGGALQSMILAFAAQTTIVQPAEIRVDQRERSVHGSLVAAPDIGEQLRQGPAVIHTFGL